jgi:sec-independent protein translocase protein TatA
MNVGDLFDSPWKVLIIAVVVLVLFGSKKMPDAARSLGRSMRILKSEVSNMHDDEKTEAAAPVSAPAPVAQAPALTESSHQQQLDQLQQQVRDLQQQAASLNGAVAAEAQHSQQSS